MSHSPVFEAVWEDGVKTRMSTYCVPAKLDLSRGVRLSAHAYDSRTKGRGKSRLIVKAHFESPDTGEVLAEYESINPRDHGSKVWI